MIRERSQTTRSTRAPRISAACLLAGAALWCIHGCAEGTSSRSNPMNEPDGAMDISNPSQDAESSVDASAPVDQGAAPSDAGSMDAGNSRDTGAEPDLPVDSGSGPWWPDEDEDGFGDENATSSDTPQSGWVANNTDCDDTDPDVYPGANDLPDMQFTDANCDGIDGTWRDLLFVDEKAMMSGDGGPMAPFQTLSEALTAAAELDYTVGIAVSKGTYKESLTLVDGVSIYGGYDANRDWERAENHAVVVLVESPRTEGMIGAVGVGIEEQTTLELFRLEVKAASASGQSVYGIHLTESPGIFLSSMTVVSGDGSAGDNGADGAKGDDGGHGTDGGDCGGAPGVGGSTTCAQRGGNGGAGGVSPGDNGADGSPVGCGGTGGAQDGCTGEKGNDGCSPVTAGDGANGDGGQGRVDPITGYWDPGHGRDGDPGSHGGPGGGGGGGGQAPVIGSGDGGAGGGGGAGGCGGAGGIAGEGGGSSFALFLVRSTGVEAKGSSFASGKGGNGGSGGKGGGGGTGGNGGSGGDGRSALSCGGACGQGQGGAGGKGGDGGVGGHGGGGAGGSSVPIYCVDSLFSTSGNALTPKEAGTPGTSEGSAGIAGVSQGTLGCR